MGQILFEKFETPYIYIENQPKLSFINTGRFEGFLLDSGYYYN
jgi:hypothetical protein